MLHKVSGAKYECYMQYFNFAAIPNDVLKQNNITYDSFITQGG